MLLEMSHSFFIINGDTLSSESLKFEISFEGNVLYEVIRIMDGRPLFLQGHLDRLGSSLSSVQGQNIDKENLREKIKIYIDKLIMLNKLINNNVKLLIGNIDGEEYDLIVHGNPSYYPEKDLYKSGITTLCVSQERQDPNVKAVNDQLTEKIAKLKEERNIFEALLVDRNGNITEGSKSNIFFIKGDVLLTPTVEAVLPGITRSEVIKSAKSIGVEVRETEIKAIDVLNAHGDIDAAFLTGTSLHIMPIKKIDDRIMEFENNITLASIMKAFEKRVKDAMDS